MKPFGTAAVSRRDIRIEFTSSCDITVTVKTRPESDLSEEEFLRLAGFRGVLRAFQTFSEQAAHALGLTSLQYQTLLAIKVLGNPAPVTVKTLSASLLIKHNSTVGLVDRIEHLGLVERRQSAGDRRSVVVVLTRKGQRALDRLAAGHRLELRRVAPQLLQYARSFAQPVDVAPS